MTLEVSDALTVIAEIAVGLAGFAGLIVTLRNRGLSSWPQTDRIRLRSMLMVACGTFFAALLPYLVGSIFSDIKLSWSTSGFLLGTGLLVLLVILLLSTWQTRHQMVRFWWVLYLLGTSVSGVVVLISSFDDFGLSPITGYLIGLLWMLFFSTTLFVRLILAPTMNPDGVSDDT